MDSSRPAADTFDIAVVGGGLIGAAAALGAAQRGRRVVLVEQHAPTLTLGRLGHDLRNIAASPATRALLEGLDAWRLLDPAPYRQMRIWDARGTGAMVFDATEVSRTELGWMLENSPTLVALWHALARESNLVLQVGAPLRAVTLGASDVQLDLGTTTVRARLLVAADGARSRVRDALGIVAESRETGHHALATLVRTELPHQGVAFQCFLDDGPLALLPGRDPQISSIVWSQSPANAESRAALSEPAFGEAVSRLTDGCLGQVLAVDERQVVPLRQMLAESFNPRPRVLLIGDAARVLHPLAGLGANVGFEDVRDFLDVLARLPDAVDPGQSEVWRVFARQRRIRSQVMLGLMATVQRLYTGGDPWRQWLRSTGVGLLNGAIPIKRQIMVEAMGLGPLAGGG